MSDGNGELPEGWEWSTLKDVVSSITYGHTASATDEPVGPRFLRITDIQNGSVNWETVPYCECDGDDKYALKNGDIVIARTGATTGKSFLIDDLAERSVFASYLIRLETLDDLSAFYLSQFMQTPHYWQQITTVSKGSAQPGANASILSKLAIPVAPLPEQRRIVSKIESLQERSSRARRALAEVGPLLEQFRQSVLAAAFRGDLTADWREAHPDVEPAMELLERIRTERRRHWAETELAKFEKKGREPKNERWKDRYPESQPLNFESELPEIPPTWEWTNWDALTMWVTYGFTRPMPHVEAGPMIVTAKNVRNEGLQLDVVDYTTEEAFAELNPKDLPLPGDILIIKDGATTGRAALVPDDLGEFCINQSVGVVWLKYSPMNRLFLLRWVQSPLIQRMIQEAMAGMAMPHLSVTDFKAMPVPIPPLEEQEAICEALENCLDIADGLREYVSESLSDLTQLDQSILAKAFRGELVPQDPNDEPASVLLERIRTTRDAGAAAKNVTKKVPRKKAAGK